MVDVGFLGAGYIARRHAAAVTAAGGRVVLVHDVDGARAHSFAEAHGATIRSSLEDLIESAPDAVFICVPPDSHGASEKLLVDHGIPFFVEKPLPPDIDMARAIASSVIDAGLLTCVGYHWRHLDRLTEVRSLLAERPAHLAVAQWHDGFPLVPWWGSRARSGGQVVEQVTHLVDACRLLLGEVTTIQAMESRASPEAGRPAGADVASSSAALAKFTSGAIAVFASSCTMPRRHSVAVELFCEGRAISLSEEAVIISEGARRTQLTVDSDPFLAQAQAFLAAVEGGPRDSLVSYGEALLSHEVAVMISAAAQG